jgi:hypothetical protein
MRSPCCCYTAGQVCVGQPKICSFSDAFLGSIQEFLPVVKPLTQRWTSPTGKAVSYNVIVPSLPGFLFSSPPPQNWTNAETAALFNTLMTDVLGYSKYALHATDWVFLSFVFS